MPKRRLHVLAVEPEPVWRENLRSLLADRISAELEFADTVDVAAAALRSRLPDLVLVSAVMAPQSEERVIRLLKELDPYATVPVLTIPPAIAPFEAEEITRRRFSFFSRKPQPRPVSYDPLALAGRIGETLSQLHDTRSRGLRLAPNPNAVDEAAAGHVRNPAVTSEPTPVLTLVPRTIPADSSRSSLPRKQRRRAHRLTPQELPWRCALTTPKGVVVRVLNVSATGVLFESPLKFTPASETSLYLFGPDTKLVLPAHFVRSEVSEVSPIGVKYRTAAAFTQRVELFAALGGSPAKATPTPQALAELLVRVTTNLNASGDYAEARADFESGLRQLAPSCEIRLLAAPLQSADAGDSIYFTVPSPKGAVLQATFDPDHEPSLEEFNLLRAAAAVAAVIVQFESTVLTLTA